MFLVELLTIAGVIPLSKEIDVKDKEGNLKKMPVPLAFESRDKALEYMNLHLKEKRIYAFHIKEFTPFNDSKLQ